MAACPRREFWARGAHTRGFAAESLRNQNIVWESAMYTPACSSWPAPVPVVSTYCLHRSQLLCVRVVCHLLYILICTIASNPNHRDGFYSRVCMLIALFAIAGHLYILNSFASQLSLCTSLVYKTSAKCGCQSGCDCNSKDMHWCIV